MIRYNAKTIKVKNKLRDIVPLRIGPKDKTALKVTVGVTPEYSDIKSETLKISKNIKYGMDIASDVTISSLEDIKTFHTSLIKEIPIPIASVPAYEIYLQMKKDNKKIITKDILKKIILRQAKRGIDMMSIHAGFKKKHLILIKKTNKYVDVTARTGGILHEYMNQSKRENPFYEYFDDILDILKEYNITLSMAQVFRPACIAEGIDETLKNEIDIQSELVKKALAKNVNTIVEVGGHIKLSLLKQYMKTVQAKFNGAILSMMGPILTDVSIGHDHITSSIGFTLAGIEGADMVVNITPDEHIAIPKLKSTQEGIIAHKIACHIIDMYKINDEKNDLAIANLRKKAKACFVFNEGKQFLIDPYNPNLVQATKECTMCGALCPYKKT